MLLIVIHVLVCLFLVAVILIQPGKADGGIGFGSAASQSIFGSKAAGNFLTKTTAICAVVFLLTSFILTRQRMQDYTKSVISEKAAQSEPAPATAKGGTTDKSPAGSKTQAEPSKAAPQPAKTADGKGQPMKSEPAKEQPGKAEPAKSEKK